MLSFKNALDIAIDERCGVRQDAAGFCAHGAYRLAGVALIPFNREHRNLLARAF
jgi:hypothetical protein